MSTEMRPEQGIAGKFVRSALDENGVLSKIEFTNSENFNFAYDVMDALAEKEPDQTALIYVSRIERSRRNLHSRISRIIPTGQPITSRAWALGRETR